MAPSKAQPPQAKPKTASGHNAKKSTTSTPGAHRPVVPAIPLPMMQRQSTKASKAPTNTKKHVTPTTNTSSNGYPAASLDAALIDQPVSPDSAKGIKEVKGQHMQSAKPSENEVNGSNVEKPEKVITTQSNTIPATATPVALATTNGANASSGQIRATPNGTNRIDTQPQQTTAANQPSSAPSNTKAKLDTVDLTSPSVVDKKLGKAKLQRQSIADLFYLAHKHLQTITGTQDAGTYTQAESIISPNRSDQPHVLNPQVHQPHRQQATDRRPDPLFYPGAHMHHHHMSNGGGGIMFGGLPESHTPSPAPPGSFMPPPPMPVNGENPNFAHLNGHHHAHSNGNGFPAPPPAPAPINTQFRPDLAGGPVSSIDTYGPLSAHVHQGPFDVLPPGASRYGPPTPHSFHGSHASGEPNGMDNGPLPFPPNNMHYMGPGHHEHPTGHHHQHPSTHQHPPPGLFPPFLPSEAFARRQQNMVERELMESVLYFRNQFDNGELADCVLELGYAKSRHHPVKIVGHKLIFAQSQALKHYIMSARTADSSGSHTITIESDDTYLRSDAWWLAVQRLYLHPLLNLPPIVGNGGNGMDFAGDKTDRFEFCLGYAAAGHLLEIQDVLIRGLQIAADLLNWVTIELALGFVLEGTTQRHTDYGLEQDGTDGSFVDLEYGYGPGTKILMDAIMNFLVNAFPSNFELDANVSDPTNYARIPAVPSVNTVPSPRGTLPPAIARGSNPRNASKPTRLGSIKFGDLPATFPDDGPAPQREPAKCSPALSRILLNLPFDELRVVLTSESSGVSGWNSAQDRYHVVADVVAAREARRLRAVDAVRAGAIPQFLEIQKRLSAQRRHAVVELWDVLNWQEEVIHPRGAEVVPRLVRKWIPQFSAPPERELKRQAPMPAYNVPESMV
ncbi:hypothetical protein UCREL1_3952 [Eutypa lata UCREL1]|uniref:Uncharacterized protein n=1 Tax=Eutypa lata (strain UCR-EL1) TaxID=1287681 RepID=M7TGG0_EUTLA|nr:hypothetical protein UCREL1_3952 [Eutypa lata UCREL1]